MYREYNDKFYTTSYSLLRLPEYSRYFDSKFIGGLYRILASRIWRKGVASLSWQNDAGYLTELAKRYDAGKLCTYFTEEELVTDLGYTWKHIQETLTKLVEVKLIRQEKWRKGYIFQLGRRSSVTDNDGYLLGQESEQFYHDNWYSNSWCVNSGLEEQIKVLNFRIWMAQNLGSEKDKVSTIAMLNAQIEDLQNESEISDETGKISDEWTTVKLSELPRAGQAFTKPKIRSIEDNPIEVNSSKKKEASEESSQEKVEVTINDLERASGIKESLIVATKLKKIGVEKKKINCVLIHKQSSLGIPLVFPDYPMFNWGIWEARQRPTDGAITSAIYRLVQESTGVDYGAKSKKMGSLQKIIKGTAERYSLAQVAWTVAYTVKYLPQKMAYLVKNPLAISVIVSDLHTKWLEYQSGLNERRERNEDSAKVEAIVVQKTHTEAVTVIPDESQEISPAMKKLFERQIAKGKVKNVILD